MSESDLIVFSLPGSIFVRWGFSFLIVLVSRYKLFLFHNPIKLDLLGFPGICVFACGLRDHVIMRFASVGEVAAKGCYHCRLLPLQCSTNFTGIARAVEKEEATAAFLGYFLGCMVLNMFSKQREGG